MIWKPIFLLILSACLTLAQDNCYNDINDCTTAHTNGEIDYWVLIDYKQCVEWVNCDSDPGYKQSFIESIEASLQYYGPDDHHGHDASSCSKLSFAPVLLSVLAAIKMYFY